MSVCRASRDSLINLSRTWRMAAGCTLHNLRVHTWNLRPAPQLWNILLHPSFQDCNQNCGHLGVLFFSFGFPWKRMEILSLGHSSILFWFVHLVGQCNLCAPFNIKRIKLHYVGSVQWRFIDLKSKIKIKLDVELFFQVEVVHLMCMPMFGLQGKCV